MCGSYRRRDCSVRTDVCAAVVLHYRTTRETLDFLKSVENNSAGLRVLVVDNGSPQNDLEPLMREFPPTTSLLRLPRNLGFAGGLNAGIRMLRKEGYTSVICSNNDILLLDRDSLDLLVRPLVEESCPVTGPAILTPKGRNQNPLLDMRPGPEKAEEMVRYYGVSRIWSRYLLNRFLLSPLKRRFRKKKQAEDVAFTWKGGGEKQKVYALNGAFFALGPAFFSCYEGLDPHTFLYGEELILAEMVYRMGGKMAYVPAAKVFHKEDKTSDLVWGGEDRIQPSLFARESITHWYNEHYLPPERGNCR